MKKVKLTAREIKIILSVVKIYAEGGTSLWDKNKGSYFIGIDRKKYFSEECFDLMEKLKK